MRANSLTAELLVRDKVVTSLENGGHKRGISKVREKRNFDNSLGKIKLAQSGQKGKKGRSINKCLLCPRLFLCIMSFKHYNNPSR